MPLVNTPSNKSAVRLQRFNDLKFEPRFEYGHMAESSEICGSKDGSELGAGFVRLLNARIPWTIQYDEIVTVHEGSLRFHIDGNIFELFERDSIWLPAGTELVYETEHALVGYAIHPSDWQERK
jgi:ethanolamine utilization protein EutQ